MNAIDAIARLHQLPLSFSIPSNITSECNQAVMRFPSLVKVPSCVGKSTPDSPRHELIPEISRTMCEVPECSALVNKHLNDIISSCTTYKDYKISLEKTAVCTTQVDGQRCLPKLTTHLVEVMKPEVWHGHDKELSMEKMMALYCDPCTLAIDRNLGEEFKLWNQTEIDNFAKKRTRMCEKYANITQKVETVDGPKNDDKTTDKDSAGFVASIVSPLILTAFTAILFW